MLSDRLCITAEVPISGLSRKYSSAEAMSLTRAAVTVRAYALSKLSTGWGLATGLGTTTRGATGTGAGSAVTAAGLAGGAAEGGGVTVAAGSGITRSEEHTSESQTRQNLVC